MSPTEPRELNGSRCTAKFLYGTFVRSEIQPDKQRDRLFGVILGADGSCRGSRVWSPSFQYSGLGARWVATRRPGFLRPAAGSGRRSGRASQSPAATREQCGAPGRSRRGPGENRRSSSSASLRTKGAARARTGRPAQKAVGKLCEGPGRRGEARGCPPRRNAPHNSPGRARRLAARPRPAGPGSGFGPVPGGSPSCRPQRRRPARAARMFTYRERVSGLRRVHILRASHTDARLRHSQPASSLIGGLRPLARSPPGRGGGRAAASAAAPPPLARAIARLAAHPAPSGPRRGGEERAATTPPTRSSPPPERRRPQAVSTRSTNATPAARSSPKRVPSA